MDHGACPFKFMVDATQLTLSWQMKCESNRPTKNNCNKIILEFFKCKSRKYSNSATDLFFLLTFT